MKRNNVLLGLVLAVASTGAAAGAPDTEAVEYYNVDNKHYFITATASEARLVDTGAAGPGWLRTGRTFPAWLKKANAPADAKAVCRFYSAIANSHFYTASASECEGLKNPRSGWMYEGIAFYVQTPVGGRCAPGTVELMRVYNDGFANGEGSNHRFVDDPALKELMVDSSWIAEGSVFCSQAKSSGTNAPLRPTGSDFAPLAGTWKGEARWYKERGDAESKVHKPLELSMTAGGAIAGTGYGCTFTGQASFGDGFRSFFMGEVTATGCADAAFNGTYSRLKLQRFGDDTLMVKLKRKSAEGETKVMARLTLQGDPPPLPAAFEGKWVGTVSWEAESDDDDEVEANKPLTLEIAASRALTGSGFGCTFEGTVGGEVIASGCTDPLFDGAYRSSFRIDKHGRLQVKLKRESGGVEAEIEGKLLRDSGAEPPPPASEPLALPGSWEGRVEWSVGDRSGSGTIRFTVAPDGAFTGTALGCTLTGRLTLSLGGRAVVSGTVTAAGCAHAALNATFDKVEFEREGDGAFEFKLEGRHGRDKVKVKGTVRRVG